MRGLSSSVLDGDLHHLFLRVSCNGGASKETKDLGRVSSTGHVVVNERLDLLVSDKEKVTLSLTMHKRGRVGLVGGLGRRQEQSLGRTANIPIDGTATAAGGLVWVGLGDGVEALVKVTAAAGATTTATAGGSVSGYVEVDGLAELKIGSLEGLAVRNEKARAAMAAPGAHLRLVFQVGLAVFKSAPFPCTAEPSIQVNQTCRVWLRAGEQGFIATVTLVVVPAAGSDAAPVPLGQAWVPLAVLGDRLTHTFRVSLREDEERKKRGEIGLSDADLNKRLSAGPAAAATASGRVGVFKQSEAEDEDKAGSGPAIPGDPLAEIGEPYVDVEGAEGSVGLLVLEGRYTGKADAEQRFVNGVLSRFDSDASDTLDYGEVAALLTALQNFTPEELAAMFKKLDKDGSGSVSKEELVAWFQSPDFSTSPTAFSLLAFIADGPEAAVMGAFNDVSSAASTSQKKTRSGAGQLVVQDAADHVVTDASGLICLDRRTGLLVQEHVPKYVKLALSLMYHSKIGSSLVSGKAARMALRTLSLQEGKHHDSPKSKANIAHFVENFGIDLGECALPVDKYNTFNEFFTRKLKPGARPIASPDDGSVLISPADCRLAVFESHADSTHLWIKGKNYTVENLLGPAWGEVGAAMEGGGLAIARLAPQDYHRWHVPVNGVLRSRYKIDGALFTVNPIAIRESTPDVYTENKREVHVFDTAEFGIVCLVAVGATCVGSIHITAEDKASLKKGDEHGFFSFGGSTVLILFQPGAVTFDKDLLENTGKPMETIVKMGERIGVSARRG